MSAKAPELGLLPMPSPGADGSLSPHTPSTPGTPGFRHLNPLSSKVTAVLSTSFADTDFRDALQLLDERGVVNNPETRRRLRLDLQKELIDSNGDIISQFGKVAEVGRKSDVAATTVC